MRVFVGWDSRPTEREAYEVARKSAQRFGCEVIPLTEDYLRMSGMLTRPTDRRGGLFDLNSDAPCSTAFAISRFFVPLLAHSGYCIFVDCDTVFRVDPRTILAGVADPHKAVHVVQHGDIATGGSKMDGQKQTAYARKLWSSVVLWNCDHIGNRRLNLTTLNQWPGRDLHAFKWLADSEIGALDPSWNHLVGIDAPRDDAKLIHWTLGTPNMPGLENAEHADLWRSYREGVAE